MTSYINPAYKPLIIGAIREEMRNFKTFVFKEGHQIHYQPGQFITLVDNSSLQEIRRSYSIISTPVLNEPLAISVKRVDNGFFSRKLIDHVRENDVLYTTGAAGFFQLPDNVENYLSIYFFAAGSGIGPVLSLLKTVLYQYPSISVYLIYSNQSAETTAFLSELQQLEIKFPDQLHIEFLFSSLPDLRKARLNRELFLEYLSRSLIDREKTIFYTCGPESFMRMVIFLLLEEGFPKENIRKEDFNPGNKKTTARMPPDKHDYRVHLDLNGISHDFLVEFPNSILQAAKKLKLEIPFSCETGKCGSCVAHCISGSVWMSNNEVLTDKELSQGLTLTCTGHPQNGNVILKIG